MTKEQLKSIHVAKAFTLHHESLEGGKKDFAKGHHKVTAEIADHWFVKGHCDNSTSDVGADAKDAEIADLKTLLEAAQAEIADLKAVNQIYADADAAKAKGKK